MNRFLKIVLVANLIVLAILAFVYPHLMVGPGKLIPGHSKLEADCFACHAPFKRQARLAYLPLFIPASVAYRLCPFPCRVR